MMQRLGVAIQRFGYTLPVIILSHDGPRNLHVSSHNIELCPFCDNSVE